MQTKSRRQFEDSEQLTLAEKLGRWDITAPESLEREVLPLAYSDTVSVSSSASVSSSEDFERNTSVPNLPQAWAFVFKSAAFGYLQSRIRSASMLTSRKDLTVASIRQSIIGGLMGSQSRQSGMDDSLNTLRIKISWNPTRFLHEQYDNGFQEKLGNVITFSGTATDAQAASCGSYVDQVWPATGMELVEAIQVIISKPNNSHYCRRC